MRILVENSSYKLANMGDIAMLLVTVERLRAIFPVAELYVITTVPDRLRTLIPDAIPFNPDDRNHWCAQRFSSCWPRVFRKTAGANLARRGSLQQLRWTNFRDTSHSLLLRFCRIESVAARRFVEFLESVDLIVAAGAGNVADAFAAHAVCSLLMMHRARQIGIPVVMLGQGLGPVAGRQLLAVMREVMPQLNLLAVRDRAVSLALAKSVGVLPERLVVTGDDAIAPAFLARPSCLGTMLGVNLRVAPYSGLRDDHARQLAEVIGPATAQHKMAALAVPIRTATHGVSDLEAVRPIMAQCSQVEDSTRPIEHPRDVIELIARCRVVVTGSYHAGVFALAQGVPVVAVSATPYYRAKFKGLSSQFMGGCQVIDLQLPGWQRTLARALAAACVDGEAIRPVLLASAAEQVASSQQIYQAIPSQFGG
jgi:polysaccharide pyruvyl transferase WcaK-like protein